MPSQVRIISARNSAEWDRLVAGIAAGGKLGQEVTYGGCATEERADKVRRAVRTAARRVPYGARVYWYRCPGPGTCGFGAGCAFHVSITLYDMEQARAWKARQAATARQSR